jgi:SAM-dependent methyltransferase
LGIKLNVGCGRNILTGWINLDSAALPGVDIIADLDQCAQRPLPLADNAVEEFLLSHVLEHLHHPLPLMQELHRVAQPNALAIVRVPYGSSDEAFEDPTHVRQYFHSSFGYFSQPFYWRADYGYRGDWQAEKIHLVVPQSENAGLAPQAVMQKILTLRNQVQEMVVELRAIKPVREPLAQLQRAPEIELVLA